MKVFTFLRNQNVVWRRAESSKLRIALWDKLPQLIDMDVLYYARILAEFFLDYIEDVFKYVSRVDRQ